MTFARTLFALASAAALSCSALVAHADAKPDDATAMVKKGVAFIKASGKDKGYAEISSKTSQFKKEDLYLVVYGLDGTVHAHGANEKMIGKNLIDLKDIDGKLFVKERVETGPRARAAFWQDYKFTNPESTRRSSPRPCTARSWKTTVVCGGIYK